MGATTIWERWNSMLPNGSINPGKMTSFNHYSLGSLCRFLHETVGGLSPLEPGWKKALVRPQPGGSLTYAEVSHISPYGKFACDWRIKGDQLVVNITVPPNASARGTTRISQGDWIRRKGIHRPIPSGSIMAT
jgi:alpha-L-rhamnosidase